MSDAPALSLPEACRVLNIGTSAGYVMVRSGKFPCRVIKVGGQWRVPTAALRRLLDESEPVDTTPAGAA